MPDSNTIALVSVVVTGSAAVAAPLVATWREGARDQRRSMHERQSLDLVELRSVFDETAVKLGDVITALDLTGSADAADRFPLFLELRQGLIRDLGRIAVRLGSDDGALQAAEDAVSGLESLIRLLDPTSEETGVTEAILEEYQRFDDAREHFYDAAQYRVGSRVAHDDNPADPGFLQRINSPMRRLWRRHQQVKPEESSEWPG